MHARKQRMFALADAFVTLPGGLGTLDETVEIITWRRDPEWAQEEFLDGAVIRRVDRLRNGPTGAARSMLALTRLLVEVSRRADAVSAHHLLSTSYLAGAVGAVLGTPVVAVSAGIARSPGSALNLLDGKSLQARLRRLWLFPLRTRGVLVALSAEMQQDLLNRGFRRVVRIPNGVVSVPLGDRAELRAELLDPIAARGRQIVLCAGRLEPEKGIGVLLESWASSLELQESLLVFLGSGSAEGGFRRQIERDGLGESIRILPPSTRALDYLRAANVVVIPSYAEGMSNVLLEAMAAGTPVVSTAVSGAVDLIRDGENGRLVPVADSAALAQAILGVLHEPGDLGERGRETVLAECAMPHIVDLYERLYSNVRRVPAGASAPRDLAAWST